MFLCKGLVLLWTQFYFKQSLSVPLYTFFMTSRTGETIKYDLGQHSNVSPAAARDILKPESSSKAAICQWNPQLNNMNHGWYNVALSQVRLGEHISISATEVLPLGWYRNEFILYNCQSSVSIRRSWMKWK